MSLVYRIREWDDRYEVNAKNRAWVDGDEKRRGALDYIRLPVSGHNLGRGFRRLNKIAGKDAPAVFGVFVKLLELSGDNDSDLRGLIVESDGRVMTAQDIADTLDWDTLTVENALNVLMSNELQWVQQIPYSGDSRNFPEKSGNSRSETETETETETEAETEAEAEDARAGAPTAAALSPSSVVFAWNKTAEAKGWPKCSRVPGGKTGQLLAARCKDPHFQAHYETALSKLATLRWPKKPFTLATLVQPDRVRAIIDGEWDDRQTKAAPGVYTGNVNPMFEDGDAEEVAA